MAPLPASSRPVLGHEKPPQEYYRFWVRFVQVVAFLFLMDPNRGDPTEHTFDQHPHAGQGKLDHKKRKFLDSLALVAAGDGPGTDAATAVCCEQRPPQGTTLRLSRNTGITEERLGQLQTLIDRLVSVATDDATADDAELKIAFQVANLCEYKMKHILEKLHKTSARADIDNAVLYFEKYTADSDDSDDNKFRKCVLGLHTLIHLPLTTAPVELLPHLQYASKAKWRHSEQIEQLFSHCTDNLHEWLQVLYKLGRYFTVVPNMMSLAKTQPDVFLPSMRIQAVEAPAKEPLKANDDREGLVTLILKLTAKESNHVKPEERTRARGIVEELGKSWMRDNPKAVFNDLCSQTYTRHAEMQLLDYYDQHYPAENPDFLVSFMGTSKKTCYLCDLFLGKHRLNMKASATHKKLWLTWKPMPATGLVKGDMRKENREKLREICLDLEKIAKREMEERLRTTAYARKKSFMDSSAGPSLPTSSGSIISKLGMMSIATDDGRG